MTLTPIENNKVTVLGTHRVVCTPELLREAMELKWDHVSSPKKRKEAEALTRREIESAVLIEIEVPPPNSEFDFGKIHQEGLDQVAYDEHFLTDDGNTVISDRFHLNGRPWKRAAFFFHFFDESNPLQTSFGAVTCPKPVPMPERLAKLMPYEPVD